MRAYALRLADDPDVDSRGAGALREEFLRARARLPRAGDGPPPRLSSVDAWLRGFVAGTSSAADLERALAALGEASEADRARLGALLEGYPAWLAARADPTLSRDLLRRVARAIRSAPVATGADTELPMRHAALAALRRHPGIARLAPVLFERLLRPDHRAAEPSGAAGARRPRRRWAGRAGTTAHLGWRGTLMLVLLFLAVRGCLRAAFRGAGDDGVETAKPHENLQPILERTRVRDERSPPWKDTRPVDDTETRHGE